MSDFDMDKALEAEYPESHRFENPGDKLIGTFVRVDTGFTSFGPQKIVVMNVAGKEVGVWLFHSALSSQFKRARPKVGQKVGVIYLGKTKGNSGFSYHNYRVVAEPEDGSAFDWSQLDDDEDFNQDFESDSLATAGESTSASQPSPRSSWDPKAAPAWEAQAADLDSERARLERLNTQRKGQEIYKAAEKAYERFGQEPPTSREALLTETNAALLREVNDFLESGVV